MLSPLSSDLSCSILLVRLWERQRLPITVSPVLSSSHTSKSSHFYEIKGHTTDGELYKKFD